MSIMIRLCLSIHSFYRHNQRKIFATIFPRTFITRQVVTYRLACAVGFQCAIHNKIYYINCITNTLILHIHFYSFMRLWTLVDSQTRSQAFLLMTTTKESRSRTFQKTKPSVSTPRCTIPTTRITLLWRDLPIGSCYRGRSIFDITIIS